MSMDKEILVLQYAQGAKAWINRYPGWTLIRHVSLDTAGFYLEHADTSVGILDCSGLDKPPVQLEQWLDNYKGISWIALLTLRQLYKKEWQVFVAIHCYDYHTTPVSEDRLFITVGRAYGMKRLKSNLGLSFHQSDLIGRHEKFNNVFIAMNSNHNQCLTLAGEPGTGKRHIVKGFAKVKGGIFLEVNVFCMEPDGELKPLEKIFSKTDDSVVFIYINHSEQLPEYVQRYVSEYVLNGKVKSNISLFFGVDLISSEQKDKGGFSPDFLLLLNQFRLEVPPLRERGQDKILLARYYLYKISREQGKRILGFTNAAEKMMMNYEWPGNITELIEKVRRGVSECETEYVGVEHLDLEGELLLEPENLSLRKAREEADALAIKRVLDLVSGRPGRAAELLCISRASLHRLIARYGIRREP
ncbi:DNA-binding NtrC family response regulator [Oceanisphaera litoralis]|uniref:VpsR-related response regulator n=1 Tax=Oceanisphaera litoralis TaxID=225144 RepID=UPI00195EC1C2|nr:VpsR-related response regulator [Oceanisphaera litoralis]MBM7456105.1 DNA-binding NtrC family response regulator [Oceanisphaera litoralis]